MPTSKLRRALASAALVLTLANACTQTDTDATGAGVLTPDTTPGTPPSPSGTTAPPPPTTPAAPPSATPTPLRSETAVVERVVDGDTITLTDGRRVRLIGIDTPESVDPRRPVECLGREASAYLKQLLPPGTKVRLELDVEVHDRYGRTLAYVYRLSDGLFINLDLAEQGFAEQMTVPPNVRYAEQIRAAVAAARAAGRGLWGDACRAVSDGR